MYDNADFFRVKREGIHTPLRIGRVVFPILEQRCPLTLSPRTTRIPRTRPRSVRDRRVDAAKDAPFGDPPTTNADLVKPGRDMMLQRRHDGRIPPGLGGARASVETRTGTRSGGRARVGAVVAVAVAVVGDVNRRTAIDRVLSSCLPTTLDNACRYRVSQLRLSVPRRDCDSTHRQSAVPVCLPWPNGAPGHGRL